MGTLIKFLAVAGGMVVGLFLLACLAVLGEAIGQKISRAWRRWRAGTPEPAPSRTLTLLVNVDRASSLFHPSVQLSGRPLERATFVRLELVGHRGHVDLILGRRISRRAIGTEVPLPSFSPPLGLDVDDVLGWRWDVVLGDAGGELERWEEHPAPAGSVNHEGELVV